MTEESNKMLKSEAMKLVGEKIHKRLHDSNTMFSNRRRNEIWGFTRDNDHFNNDTHMILNDHKKRQLHYFFIKSGTIQTPRAIFSQRQDKDCSTIVIPVSANNFKEEYSGFLFGDYKAGTFSY